MVSICKLQTNVSGNRPLFQAVKQVGDCYVNKRTRPTERKNQTHVCIPVQRRRFPLWLPPNGLQQVSIAPLFQVLDTVVRGSEQQNHQFVRQLSSSKDLLHLRKHTGVLTITNFELDPQVHNSIHRFITRSTGSQLVQKSSKSV